MPNWQVMRLCLALKSGLLLHGNQRYFVPFMNSQETGLLLIRLLPPPALHNRIYSIDLATNSTKPPTSLDTRLQDHERLGHISFKRNLRQLNIDGITPATSKRLKPITCPVCITAKARRATSVTGVKYFAVFVDRYSGSKHVEFRTSKNHFIFGYKRFICYLGRHPKTLRSDLIPAPALLPQYP